MKNKVILIAKDNISNIVVIELIAKKENTCMPVCLCLHQEKKEKAKGHDIQRYFFSKIC